MKRIVLVAAVAMLALASCKKDYVCTVAGVEVPYKNLSKSDAETLQTACEAGGVGTWSTK